MTSIVIILTSLLFIIFNIYNLWIVEKIKGKTLSKFSVIRKGKIDGVIFIALILLLFWQNYLHITKQDYFFLAMLIVISSYTFFIRKPQIVFKNTGFFYASFFIEYTKIQNINISTEGYIVFSLNTGKDLNCLTYKNDLKPIFNQLINLKIVDRSVLDVIANMPNETQTKQINKHNNKNSKKESNKNVKNKFNKRG